MPNSSETSKLSANMKTIAEENLPLKKRRRRLIFSAPEKMYFNSVKATRAPTFYAQNTSVDFLLVSVFFTLHLEVWIGNVVGTEKIGGF